MRAPYHTLTACRGIVLAGQGGNIVSFRSDGSRLSTWKHPVSALTLDPEPEEGPKATTEAQQASRSPPAKRRRIDNTRTKDEGLTTSEEPVQSTEKSHEAGQKRKKGRGIEPSNPGNDGAPVIQELVSTADGHYIAALTGGDKTIWVFEHDGGGNLKLLSQR